MGNKLTRTTQVLASDYLQDLPSSYNLVLKEALGGGRFLKSIVCFHDEGLLLVKVYFKRGEFPDLKEYARQLHEIREQLKDIEYSHVWPFQYWLETDKAAYLLRQYFFSNLLDRISTRPFLSLTEKKWLAFQLLHALKQSHEHGVCHGDIKCENILLTSWNWVYLADYYCSLKPTYLPADNPSDFSFYFDTGGRRRCYLAPERFYEPNSDLLVTPDTPLRPAMDIFSLGCVIGEVFLEGKALFDLSQLLAYRRGQYDPGPSLEKISDPGVRDMILHMIQLNPEARLSPVEYLQMWAPAVFPDYFSPLLHEFFSCLVPLDTDARVAITQEAFPEIHKQMLADTQKNESLEVGGISDLISLKWPCVLSPERKEQPAGEFLVDDCSPSKDGAQFTLEGQMRSLHLGSLNRVKDATASAVEEVVTEEVMVYENQVREPGATFSECSFHRGKATAVNYGMARSGPLKEYMTLPLEGGWKFEGDWEGDSNWAHSGVGADEEGWKYCKMSIVDSKPEMGAGSKSEAAACLKARGEGGSSKKKGSENWGGSGMHGWTAACTPDCVWRQRQWICQRPVQPRYPILVSPSNRAPQTLLDFKVGEVSLQSPEISDPDLEIGWNQALKCEGMVLIASLLCACLRNVKLPQAKQGAIQLLYDCSLYLDDDARLQLVIPFVIALLSDSAAAVRCAALQTLCNILTMVQHFPPSDEKIFPQYILPLLSMLPDDPEESVRIAYAANIHKIAESSHKFLVGSVYLTEIGGSMDVSANQGHTKQTTLEKGTSSPSSRIMTGHPVGQYEVELGDLRETIARIIQELVMGQKQTSRIRRALLQHIMPLCRFFGPRYSNTFWLPILPAFLNDQDEHLRAVFFEHIVHVCLFAGQTSLEDYLLPYIEQGLKDVHETVIVNVLKCLVAMCTHQLLCKRVLLEVVERASPLLCHPSQWVRWTAVTFVAATSTNLEQSDSHAFLSPILAPFLQQEPASLCSEAALLACLKPQVSLEVFNRVLSDVLRLQKEREGAAAKQGSSESKGQQVTQIQPPPELIGISSNRPGGLQKQTLELDSRSLSAATGNLQERPPKHAANHAPHFQHVSPAAEIPLAQVSAEGEDGEKMKVIEGYICNPSSSMETRMHSWETESMEKLQGSATGSAVGVDTEFYLNYDLSPDSAPLDKKEEEGLQVGQSSVPQGVDGGSGSSHLTKVGSHLMMPSVKYSLQRLHAAMAGAFAPRLLPRSVYQGISPPTTQQIKVAADATQQVSGEGFPVTGFGGVMPSVSTSKASLASSFEIAGEPSPAVISGMDFSMGLAGTAHSGSSGDAENSWSPRAVLIAHLHEHQRAVNEVTISSDNIFFASASNDGTIKIWDCHWLEGNMSFRSHLTYLLHSGGRLLHVTVLGSGQKVSAASSDETVCVVTVNRLGDNAEQCTGISDMCKVDIQQVAILSLQNFSLDGLPQLLYSPQQQGIHLLDLQVQTDMSSLKEKRAQGFMLVLSLNPACNWLVSATSRGVPLWDIHSQVPMDAWQHPLHYPVENMCPLCQGSTTPASACGHPFTSVGCHKLVLWNVGDGSCHEVLKIASETADVEITNIPTALSQPLPSLQSSRDGRGLDLRFREGLTAAEYCTEELNGPTPQLPGVLALPPVSGGSAFLSAGADCRSLMSDHLRSEDGYYECGPSTKHSATVDTQALKGIQVVEGSVGKRPGRKRTAWERGELLETKAMSRERRRSANRWRRGWRTMATPVVPAMAVPAADCDDSSSSAASPRGGHRTSPSIPSTPRMQLISCVCFGICILMFVFVLPFVSLDGKVTFGCDRGTRSTTKGTCHRTEYEELQPT